MNVATLDLDAPIVPDEGLGGLTLRRPFREVARELAELLGPREPVTPTEARYRLGRGEVELAVDVRNGRVFKLIARHGYGGTLFGAIRVGMTVRDAIRLEPRLDYDEAEGALVCRGVDGLQIDLDDPDPPPDLVPDLTIDAISVFAREIATLRGQEGDWCSADSPRRPHLAETHQQMPLEDPDEPPSPRAARLADRPGDDRRRGR